MNIVDFKEWLEQFPDDTEIYIVVVDIDDYGAGYSDSYFTQCFDPENLYSWDFNARNKELIFGQ